MKKIFYGHILSKLKINKYVINDWHLLEYKDNGCVFHFQGEDTYSTGPNLFDTLLVFVLSM